MVISDNGASAEGGVSGSFNEMLFFNDVPERFEENLARIDELGGVDAYNHYPWGWTWAGNTPFRRWKRETYRGGATDPFVVSWPAEITARGELRAQYAHAIDMVPTVLDALGVEPPASVRGVAQAPLEGVSFAHTFDAPDAATRHETQYFEMFGHRSIYHDGWRAVCPWPGPNFADAAQQGRKIGEPITREVLERLDRDGWELYDIADDPTESRDVAAEHADVLRELIALWWEEAEKYKVLPLDGSMQARLRRRAPADLQAADALRLLPGRVGRARVRGAAGLQPGLLDRGGRRDRRRRTRRASWSPREATPGGYAFYLDGGRPCHVYNYVGRDRFVVQAPDVLPPGRHALRYEFEPTGAPDFASGKGAPGRGQLYVDGRLVANTELPHTTPFLFELEGLSCGYDFGAPAAEGYQPPFPFTGAIHSVTFDLAGELIVDEEAELRRLMAQQ